MALRWSTTGRRAKKLAPLTSLENEQKFRLMQLFH